LEIIVFYLISLLGRICFVIPKLNIANDRLSKNEEQHWLIKMQTCTVHLKAGLQGVAEQSAINRKAKLCPPMHAAHANQNSLVKAILPSGFSFFFPLFSLKSLC
jgi:hypothetical protein